MASAAPAQTAVFTAKSPHRSRIRHVHRLRVLAYFVLGLIALDLAVRSQHDLWQTHSPDDYALRVSGCRREARDLVVIGGSPVSEGIDPSAFRDLPWHGTPLSSVYTLGMPGATTTECYHAVRHGLISPPRVIVYGITASDVNDRRNEPHGADALMDWSDLALWWRVKPRSGEWVTRHFVQSRLSDCWQLYRQRNGIRLWAATKAEQLWPGSFPDAAAEARNQVEYSTALRGETGFAPDARFAARRLDAMKAQGQGPGTFGFLDGFRMGDHWRYLHRLLDWCVANQVTVVLVDMPVPADLDERLYPQAFVEYRAALAEFESDRSITVLRPTRETLGISDAHFADLIHLNAEGCTILSGWIRNQLVRLETAR